MTAQGLRPEALRRGVRLEIFTIGWMVIEAAIAIGAGIAARSMLLTAFGLDSAIELISGAVLFWRLSAEARSADVGRVEVVERRAIRVSAVLLLLLSLYVLTTSIAGLLTKLEPRDSWAGLGISAAAVLVMPLLAWQKQRANEAIHLLGTGGGKYGRRSGVCA